MAESFHATLQNGPLAPPQSRGRKSRRLADDLRKMIAGMQASERFPSVAELEKQYQVSTSTVEVAVNTLQAEGLLVRRRGSGTFVADTAKMPKAHRRTGHLVITTIGSGGVINIFSAMAQALEAEMRRAGYDPVLLFDNHPQTRLIQAQQRWEAGSVDGYVHVGSLDEKVAFPPVPGVVIGEVAEGAPVHQVVVDNFGAGRRAGEYLWDLGHRHIAFITTESMLSGIPRLRGLQSLIMERGGSESSVELLPVPSGLEQSFVVRIENVLKTLLNRSSGQIPTALFFANDQVAFPSLQILLSWGVRIPQDLSVISFDDTPGLASQTRPALTSLRMPTLGLAALAMQTLHQAITEPGLPFRHLRLPAELIIRESSGPSRITDFVSRLSEYAPAGNVPPPTFPLEENHGSASPQSPP